MNPSPLQLEHYELASLQIEPIEGYVAAAEARYPSFNHADFESSVEFGQAARGDETPNYLWGIKLRLRGGPKEGESFPYRFDVSVIGFLNGEAVIEGKQTRQDLVLVNGTSLLYGVLRDEVLRLTSRMRHGALLLPTASFHSLANTHGSGKTKEDPSSHDAAPVKARQLKT